MANNNGILNVIAAGLLFPTIGEKVNVSNWLQQSKSIDQIVWPIGVNDNHQFGVRDIQFSGFLPEQVSAEKGRCWIQSSDFA